MGAKKATGIDATFGAGTRRDALHAIAERARAGASRTRGTRLVTAVLFSGRHGTGKALAAQALANELERDLLSVDLSLMVSKYIGETEKNLAKLFARAEHTGAILFFDEADALFGRRTSVKDAHDRYANQEIGYLLQRLESFSGLAIVATNSVSNIDPAFTRRFAYAMRFPRPARKR